MKLSFNKLDSDSQRAFKEIRNAEGILTLFGKDTPLYDIVSTLEKAAEDIGDFIDDIEDLKND